MQYDVRYSKERLAGEHHWDCKASGVTRFPCNEGEVRYGKVRLYIYQQNNRGNRGNRQTGRKIDEGFLFPPYVVLSAVNLRW